MSSKRCLWIAGVLIGVFAPEARAADADPPVAEVVQQALRYFRIHPEAIDSIRSAAHTRALVPLVSGGFRYDDDKFARIETMMPDPPVTANEDTNRRTNAISVGVVWDFRELVFNPAEIQVYGLIGVQRDLMLEVTRTYYLRKQLQLLKKTKPPEDPVSAATLDLRIDEYTAILDVLTGGWFSQRQGK